MKYYTGSYIGGNTAAGSEACSGNKLKLVPTCEGIATGQVLQEIELAGDNFFLWEDHIFLASQSYLRKVAPASGEVIWEQRMDDYVRLYSGITPRGYTNLLEAELLWALSGEDFCGGGAAEEIGYYPLEITAFHPEAGYVMASWEFSVPFQYGGPWYWPIKQIWDTQDNSYLLFESDKNMTPFFGHLQFGKYRSGRGLHVIDANTSQELWEYQYGENHINVLASDGDYLAMVTKVGEEYAVQFLTIATGEPYAQISLTDSPCRMIGNKLLMYQQGEYVLTDPFVDISD